MVIKLQDYLWPGHHAKMKSMDPHSRFLSNSKNTDPRSPGSEHYGIGQLAPSGTNLLIGPTNETSMT